MPQRDLSLLAAVRSMSALRIPGPDGRTILLVIDDGAVGRISFARRGIRGGSPYVGGTMVTGEDQRTRDLRLERQRMALLRRIEDAL